jgi:hypothetical protein
MLRACQGLCVAKLGERAFLFLFGLTGAPIFLCSRPLLVHDVATCPLSRSRPSKFARGFASDPFLCFSLLLTFDLLVGKRVAGRNYTRSLRAFSFLCGAGMS